MDHFITVTELIGAMGHGTTEVQLDLNTQHIIGYADGVIRTVDGHITRVKHTRIELRRLIEDALG